MKKKLTSAPLVSVIMPVYNAAEFLPDAIESILSQDFQDFEFIIVDDASTDSSASIIKRYESRFPSKIHGIYLGKNRNSGGDSCANQAFHKARGRFIARMDADDIAYPTRLSKQVAFLKSHKDVIVVGTQADIINRKGIVVGEKLEPGTDHEIRKSYFSYHPMIHPSLMIRRSKLPKRKDLYVIQHNANNDLLTFFELLQYGKFANLDEKLMKYRIHGKNDSLTDPRGRFFNTLKIRLYAWRHLGYKPTLSGWFMTFAQLVAILALPPELAKKLYLAWRGISNKAKAKQSVRFSPKLGLSN